MSGGSLNYLGHMEPLEIISRMGELEAVARRLREHHLDLAAHEVEEAIAAVTALLPRVEALRDIFDVCDRMGSGDDGPDRLCVAVAKWRAATKYPVVIPTEPVVLEEDPVARAIVADDAPDRGPARRPWTPGVEFTVWRTYVEWRRARDAYERFSMSGLEQAAGYAVALGRALGYWIYFPDENVEDTNPRRVSIAEWEAIFARQQ